MEKINKNEKLMTDHSDEIQYGEDNTNRSDIQSDRREYKQSLGSIASKIASNRAEKTSMKRERDKLNKKKY